MRSNERDNLRGKDQVRGSNSGKYKDNGKKRGERQKKKKPLIEIQENFLGVTFASCNICLRVP